MINIAVIFILLGMAYWWSLQGFFSSLLHLMLVIVSGCVAFAFWETAAFKLMGVSSFAAQFAYCLGLILPFFVCLLVLRIAFDKVIKNNLYFIPLVDAVGGGALGLVSGALTGGIFLLGINFSPVSKEFLGYQPVIVNSTGTGASYSDGSKLWVKIDQFTTSFFSRIGSGAMAPTLGGENLVTAYPDLLMAAHTWRQHPDINSLRVALPDAVSVDAVRVTTVSEEFQALLSAEIKEAMGSLANGSKLLIVETTWRKTEEGGTYDSGTVVRVGPNQVAIFVDGGMIPPMGFVQEGYQGFASTKTVARGLGSSSGDKLSFVFALPSGTEPSDVYIRGLRFPIDQVDSDPTRLLATLTSAGAAVAQTPTSGDVPWLGGRQISLGDGDDDASVSLTNDLPRSVSKNSMGAGDTVNGDSDSGLLPGDNAFFKGSATSGNAIKTLKIESFFAPVRMSLQPRQMRSMLGRARQLAANLMPLPRLQDAAGDMHDAVAFATNKSGEGMRVYYGNAGGGLQRELGALLNQLDDETELFLYFAVRPGRHITGYSLAGKTFEPCDFYIPTEEEADTRR